MKNNVFASRSLYIKKICWHTTFSSCLRSHIHVPLWLIWKTGLSFSFVPCESASGWNR